MYYMYTCIIWFIMGMYAADLFYLDLHGNVTVIIKQTGIRLAVIF